MRWILTAISLAALAAACSPQAKAPAEPAKPAAIMPGPTAAADLQKRLIEAKPGDVVEIGAGTFAFTDGLSLDVANVTIKGAGQDKTILSFKGQAGAGEGLLVTSKGVTLTDFAVQDTKGDGIKSKGADNIIYRHVTVEWTGGPKPENGSYGVYPVESTNVLIDDVTVKGASDAGIYVGQSDNIIVRNSRAENNVAGIEIENSSHADVHDNVATHNAGGILVFDLPDLPKKGGNSTRVFNNKIVENNTPNFAKPGNIVGNVPTGTGVMLMANKNVHVFNNTFDKNQSAHVMIVAYQFPIKDAVYDPLPRDIVVRDNTYGEGGNDPQGLMAPFAKAIGGKLPPVFWDGITKYGDKSEPVQIVVREKPDVGFLNFGLGKTPPDPKNAKPSTKRPADAQIAEPAEVKLPQESAAS
ncbi:MAG: parallel beta-helix domain-containing protein [Alphaproteobacteria bacterium]